MNLKLYKIIILSIFLTLTGFVFADEAEEEIAETIINKKTSEFILPDNLNLTDRFILTEQKELRIDLEKLKRELIMEVQNRELSSVDRALSYSANTINFFFVFLSVIIMGLGVIGWKTLSDTKNSIKEQMEKRVEVIINNFQKKIKELEIQQKVNVLWRQYYSSESNTEKLEIMKKIEEIKPLSKDLKIERSNIYLEMGTYDKVIELCTEILEEDFDCPQAIYNRAFSYAVLKKYQESKEDVQHLLSVSPDYQRTLEEEDVFEKVL